MDFSCLLPLGLVNILLKKAFYNNLKTAKKHKKTHPLDLVWKPKATSTLVRATLLLASIAYNHL